MGSADLMERNLDRRVETLCRVRDAAIMRHLRDVVPDAYLRDNERAYMLVNDDYQKAAAGQDGSLERAAAHARSGTGRTRPWTRRARSRVIRGVFRPQIARHGSAPS